MLAHWVVLLMKNRTGKYSCFWKWWIRTVKYFSWIKVGKKSLASGHVVWEGLLSNEEIFASVAFWGGEREGEETKPQEYARINAVFILYKKHDGFTSCTCSSSAQSSSVPDHSDLTRTNQNVHLWTQAGYCVHWLTTREHVKLHVGRE